MIDGARAQSTARTVAKAALGYDAGPLYRVDSKSHQVFVGDEAVVKLIDAGDHSRLDREIALGVDLPAGITAPVLAHGRIATEGGDMRYACSARQPGASPGMGLVGVDREPRFVGQARQHADFNACTIGRPVLQPVPSSTRSSSTGDSVHDDQVTVLLDFEWARFGEPVDDWMFLSRFSGPHMPAVLAVVAELTKTSLDSMRAACQLRESSYLASDLLIAVLSGDHNEAQHTAILLDRVVRGRLWWEL